MLRWKINKAMIKTYYRLTKVKRYSAALFLYIVGIIIFSMMSIMFTIFATIWAALDNWINVMYCGGTAICFVLMLFAIKVDADKFLNENK